MVEARRVRVAEMYRDGATQAEIGREVGVTQSQVSLDLKAVREQWRERYTRDLHERKLVELANCDAVEASAWTQFRRSCEDEHVIVQELAAGTTQPRITRYTTRTRTGNPSYLMVVLACVERRCKILGIDAPMKHAETTAEGRDITAEARAERAQQVLAQFGYRAGTPSAG